MRDTKPMPEPDTGDYFRVLERERYLERLAARLMRGKEKVVGPTAIIERARKRGMTVGPEEATRLLDAAFKRHEASFERRMFRSSHT